MFIFKPDIFRPSNAAADGRKRTREEEAKMETFIICMLAMFGGYAIRIVQEIERR